MNLRALTTASFLVGGLILSSTAARADHTVSVGGWALKGGNQANWSEDFGGIVHNTTDTDSVELPIPIIFDQANVFVGGQVAAPKQVQFSTQTNLNLGLGPGSVCTSIAGIVNVSGFGASFFGSPQHCSGTITPGVSIPGLTNDNVTVPGETVACNFGQCFPTNVGGYAYLYVTVNGVAGITSIMYSTSPS
jgi:hypothetical protein